MLDSNGQFKLELHVHRCNPNIPLKQAEEGSANKDNVVHVCLKVCLFVFVSMGCSDKTVKKKNLRPNVIN